MVKYHICEQASKTLHHINRATLFAVNSAMTRLQNILRGLGLTNPWNILKRDSWVHKMQNVNQLLFTFAGNSSNLTMYQALLAQSHTGPRCDGGGVRQNSKHGLWCRERGRIPHLYRLAGKPAVFMVCTEITWYQGVIELLDNTEVIQWSKTQDKNLFEFFTCILLKSVGEPFLLNYLWNDTADNAVQEKSRFSNPQKPHCSLF